MSCRIDMADLFGDETIEIVDLGGKETENLDSTIVCPIPAICAEICTKEIDEKDDDNSPEARETETEYELEERVLPEGVELLAQKTQEISRLLEIPSCTQKDETSPMCSPMMIQHVDQKAQAEIRKVELEELRQLSLAKLNAAKLGDAAAPTELAEFFDKQKEMSLEQRRNQRDAMELLHKYRDDGQRALGEIRRTSSKDSECSSRRGTTVALSTLSRAGNVVAEAELATLQRQQFLDPAPMELIEINKSKKKLSPEQQIQPNTTEFLPKSCGDGQHVPGEIGRTSPKDSDAAKPVTEEELALQRQQLLQQSTERVKRFQNLHAYRVQNALVECSSGESGTPIPKKPDYRLLTLSIDSPTTILEVDQSKDDEAKQNGPMSQHSQTDKQSTNGEELLSGDRRVVDKAQGDKLQIPNAEKDPESKKGSLNQGENATLLQASVGDMDSTLVLLDQRSNPLEAETPIDSHAMVTQSTKSTHNLTRQDDYDKPFVGCELGCLEIRVNLDHAYAGVQNLTNALSTPKCGDSRKDTLADNLATSPKDTDNINKPRMTKTAIETQGEVFPEAKSASQPCYGDSDEEGSTKSVFAPLEKTKDNATAHDDIKTYVPKESPTQQTRVEQTEPMSPSFKENLESRTVAKEPELPISSPKGEFPQQTPADQIEHKSSSFQVDQEPGTVAPILESSIGPSKEYPPRSTSVEQSEPKPSSQKIERASRIVAPKVKSPSTPKRSSPRQTRARPSVSMSSPRHAERVSRITAPKLRSPTGSTKVSQTPRTPNLGRGAITVGSTLNSSPRSPDSSSSQTFLLTNVPLYVRSVARKKPERGPICPLKYVPQLHKSRAACERCLYWASAEEKEKFDSTGYHLRIMKCRGGCDRDCAVFPRMKNEFPVRLCKKCFFDTHLTPKKKDDDESCSIFSKSSGFSKK